MTVCGGRVCRGRICVQSQGNSWDPLGLLGTYLALGPVSNCNTESIKKQPVDVMAKLTLQLATFFVSTLLLSRELMTNLLLGSLVAEQNAFQYKHIYGPTSAMKEQSWNLTSVLQTSRSHCNRAAAWREKYTLVIVICPVSQMAECRLHNTCKRETLIARSCSESRGLL